MRRTDTIFLVTIHDVALQWMAQVAALIEQLKPLVENRIAAAVVPRWHGTPIPLPDSPFTTLLGSCFGEVLLHGYTHHSTSRTGLISLLTNQADEFSDLAVTEATQRICMGQTAMQSMLGSTARGFIPPAWQYGPLRAAMLASCGLKYSVGMHALIGANGTRIPLTTWSWDTGRFARLGYMAEALGVVLFAARRRAIPCVVFHPADIERGFAERGIHLVRVLLASGRRPILFSELV